MKKIKIFITRSFPGPGIEQLKNECDVTVNTTGRVLSKRELMQQVKGVDVIVSLLTDKIDSDVMDAAGDQLKLISNYAIGFDNIDTKAASDRGILVTNTPGQETITDAIAEHTFALILTVARRILEADVFSKAHKYKQWEPALLLGQQLRGKTLGIVGLGRIGIAVVRMAQVFGMSVLYADEIRNKKLESEYGVSYVDKETLLRTSDVVSLHVPLLPSTYHYISVSELSIMKPTSILINTARGPVVDEKALAESLKKQQIFGAGLDVFEEEPKVNHDLARLDNVILTPHISSSTVEARDEMSQLVADNVLSFVKTGKVLTPVQ